MSGPAGAGVLRGEPRAGVTPCPCPLCSQLPEEALLGDRLDSHDWDKISNVNVSPAARAGSAPVIEAVTCVGH